MPVGVTFVEKDSELVQQIKEFQKEQGLPTFVSAVRLLCKNGLNMNDVVKVSLKVAYKEKV